MINLKVIYLLFWQHQIHVRLLKCHLPIPQFEDYHSEIREYRDLLNAGICNIFSSAFHSGILKDPLYTNTKSSKID